MPPHSGPPGRDHQFLPFCTKARGWEEKVQHPATRPRGLTPKGDLSWWSRMAQGMGPCLARRAKGKTTYLDPPGRPRLTLLQVLARTAGKAYHPPAPAPLPWGSSYLPGRLCPPPRAEPRSAAMCTQKQAFRGQADITAHPPPSAIQNVMGRDNPRGNIAIYFIVKINYYAFP